VIYFLPAIKLGSLVAIYEMPTEQQAALPDQIKKQIDGYIINLDLTMRETAVRASSAIVAAKRKAGI
jgi:hypothetical protein